MVQVTSRPLFRWDAASKSVDHSSDAKGPVSTPLQNNPPKRMLSQKALLSLQPLSRLSRRAKSTTVPKETTPSSSDKFENSGRGEAAYSCADYLSHWPIPGSCVPAPAFRLQIDTILIYFYLSLKHTHTHTCMYAQTCIERVVYGLANVPFHI